MSWSLVTLGSLEGGKGNFVDGPFGSNLKSSEYTETGVPLIQLKNIKPNKYITKDLKFVSQEKADSISRHSYKSGDVCIAKLGAVGTACIIPDDAPDGIIVADVVRFRGDKTLIDYKYLCHFLNSPDGQRRVLALSRGSTRTRTNLTDLKKVEIPLPPLDKQKRIAAVLDKADAIRRKRQQAIQLADDFLRSVFLDMFGDPVRNPKGWEVKAVEELSIRVTKGESPKWQGFEYCSSGVRFITSENVLWGKLDNRIKYIPEAFHEKLKRSQVQHGDLLINLVGASVGRACLADIEDKTANINQAVAVTTFNQTEIISELALIQVLLPSVQRVLLGNAVDAARANVSLKNIRELEFVVPPMGLQLEFMERVSVFRELENKFAQSNQSDLFNSLSQKAFAGEL